MPQASLAVVHGLVHAIFGRVRYNPAFQTPVFHAYLRIAGGRETQVQTVSTAKLLRYKPPSRGNCV